MAQPAANITLIKGEDTPTNKTAPLDFSFEEQILAYSCLYMMALLCIIWGTMRSLAFVKGHISRKELIEISITTKDAKKFPITASAVLFGLYLIFKINEGKLLTVTDKLEPYLPPNMHQIVHEKVEIFQNYFHTPTNATNSATIGTNDPIKLPLTDRIAGYHPILAQAVQHPITQRTISLFPEPSKQNLVFLLLSILCLEGCVALSLILKPMFSFILGLLPVGDRWPRRNVTYLFSLKRGKREMKEGELERASKKDSEYLFYGEFDTHLTIAFCFCALVGISHVYRRHWITNNLLGVAFSIYGIECLHLASIKAGVILLSGLFIYDVFWVFATEVMTTVAKGIDVPILLMFPQDLLKNGWLNANRHGMLGLGDIVIPGIFIALLYRFDNRIGTSNIGGGGGGSKQQGKQQPKARFYFWVTVVAYAFGLLITMGVMHFFKAAQPALLYLVPTCVLTPFTVALFRGEFRALWNYSEDSLTERGQQQHGQPSKKQKEKSGASDSTNQSQQPAAVKDGPAPGEKDKKKTN